MADLTLIPSKFADLTTTADVNVASCIGLFVGGAGVVKVQGSDGNTATFTVQAGAYLTGKFTKVLSSGTTATGIVALYA